jgi:hypothetical protein
MTSLLQENTRLNWLIVNYNNAVDERTRINSQIDRLLTEIDTENNRISIERINTQRINRNIDIYNQHNFHEQSPLPSPPHSPSSSPLPSPSPRVNIISNNNDNIIEYNNELHNPDISLSESLINTTEIVIDLSNTTDDDDRSYIRNLEIEMNQQAEAEADINFINDEDDDEDEDEDDEDDEDYEDYEDENEGEDNNAERLSKEYTATYEQPVEEFIYEACDLYQCGICLDNHQTKNTIITCCNHAFGLNCFKRWRNTIIDNRRNVITCPTCRYKSPETTGFVKELVET